MNSRPFDELSNAIGSTVLVKLKGGKFIRGKLLAFDVHLNVILSEAEELDGEEVQAKHPKIIVRGDNIIFITL